MRFVADVDRSGAGPPSLASRRLARLGATGAAVLALVALGTAPALADHGLGHNGETMTLSKEADIADGETVTVTLTSFLPDASITVVTCYNFPSVGPADCELSNYGRHTATADADGMATVEYPVSVVPGRCDHENSCYIVAGDGIGPNANYAGVPVTFAVVEAAAEEEATDDSAAEEEAEEMSAMEAAEEEPPAPETTAAPAPETTAAPAPETTAAPEPEPVAAPAADDGDSGGGGSAGLVVVIVVVAVVVVGGGVVLVRRRSA